MIRLTILPLCLCCAGSEHETAKERCLSVMADYPEEFLRVVQSIDPEAITEHGFYLRPAEKMPEVLGRCHQRFLMLRMLMSITPYQSVRPLRGHCQASNSKAPMMRTACNHHHGHPLTIMSPSVRLHWNGLLLACRRRDRGDWAR